MHDDSLSLGSQRTTHPVVGNSAEFLRAEQARVGNWLASRLRLVLFGLLILEIPLQLDTYLYHDLEDAKFGAISGFNFSLTTFCLVLLYAQWIPRHIVESRRFVFSKSLFAYVAITALTILWAADKTRTMFQVFLLFQAFLIFIYVVNQVKTRRDVMFVMTLLMVGLAIQGAFMLAAKIIGDDISIGPLQFEIINKTDRVTGSFASPNAAGSYFALLAAPCFSVLLMPVSRRFKLFAVAAFILACIAIVFTMSRGGWFAAGISIAVLSFVAVYKGWMSRRVFSFLAVSVVLLVVVFHQTIANRLMGDDDGSAAGRMPLSAISKTMIVESPLGVGGNNWDLAAAAHAEKTRYRGEWFYFVHNKYLLVSAETGWLGLAAYVTFLGTILACGWRAIKRNDRLLSPLALGLMAGTVGQMIHMSKDVFNGRSQIQMLWLVAALIVAICNMAAISDENEAEPSMTRGSA